MIARPFGSFDFARSWRVVLPWSETALARLCGLVLLLLSGCDGLGLFGGDDAFDVPPERLVTMTAVYEEILPGGWSIQRLVVADVQTPSNYKVLSKAGKYAERPCFGPEKRRLLFEDHKGAFTDSDAQITLPDSVPEFPTLSTQTLDEGMPVSR